MSMSAVLLSTFVMTLAPEATVAPVCQTEADCADGGSCREGRCEAAPSASCGADTDCPGDELCDAGVCRAAPAPAGGCMSDQECKGDRICVEGGCTAPATTAAPRPSSEPPTDQVAPPPESMSDGDGGSNWALGGGIATLGLMVPVMGLGLASELNREEQIPAIPLGAAATTIIAAAIPIGAAAGASARRSAGVEGKAGLRITGWVLYGLSLTNAVGLMAAGLAEVEPWPGAISTTTFLAVAAGSLMAADAFVSHGQARDRVVAARRTGPRLSLTAGPTRGRGGQVGFAMRF